MTPLSYQRADLRADVRQLFCRDLSLTFCLSNVPIHTFDLIGEYDAGDGRRDTDFKGIAFDLGRHRAAEHQTCFTVISGRTQHESGPVSSLLSPSLRNEVQPDNIAGIRNILSGHYQASLPTASPKSTASCRFSRV